MNSGESLTPDHLAQRLALPVAAHADVETRARPTHVSLLLRTETQASVHHNMFISSSCQVNHNCVEDTAPCCIHGGGRGWGQREGKRLWEEQREKDGLEEENGIKRIQMEERETDRHWHMAQNRSRILKCKKQQTQMNRSLLKIDLQHSNVAYSLTSKS